MTRNEFLDYLVSVGKAEVVIEGDWIAFYAQKEFVDGVSRNREDLAWEGEFERCVNEQGEVTFTACEVS